MPQGWGAISHEINPLCRAQERAPTKDCTHFSDSSAFPEGLNERKGTPTGSSWSSARQGGVLMFVCAFARQWPSSEVLCLPCGPGSVLADLLSLSGPWSPGVPLPPAVSYTPPGASPLPPGRFTVLHPLAQTAWWWSSFRPASSKLCSMPFKMSVSLAVPNLFGTGDKFCGRHFFHGLGVGINFGMILVRDIYCTLCFYLGFPDSSVGKESTCNPGDPGSIPGSGRSAGREIGYQFSILGLPWWLSW